MQFTFLTILVSFSCLWSGGVLAAQPQRAQLGFAQIMSATYTPAGPVSNSYFMPQQSKHPALQPFSGAITIVEHAMHTEPSAIVPAKIAGKITQLFPGIALHFVSHEGYLVPVERDLLIAADSDSYWQIQISPGRVWSEENDEGMSRASFPFFITSNIENESYNGVATFLYDDKSVSELRYQIVQQLSPFFVETWFVAANQEPIGYQPMDLASDELIDNFKKELADRLVWREWTELESKYGKQHLSDFNAGIDPQQVAASGLVIDNEVYVYSMGTPWGDYPYPREMRHGVWSATKTLAGLVTLARMAQKYGDEILDYKIRDYLHITADHNGYDNVTLRHALSMATGIGTGSENVNPNAISDGYIYSDLEAYTAWYLAPTIAEKLDYSFKVQNHPWGPGKHVRYRDRDIVLLAAALDSIYRQKEGDDADLWQMMLDEVYGPIGIHHMPMNKTKETGRAEVPFLGWGIYVTLDDIAKISDLLQSGGRYRGRQILSGGVLAEAMYETGVRGLPTGASNKYGHKTYHLSLWHESFITRSGTSYAAPKMIGWGGNIVQLMPNGMTGIRIGNAGDDPGVKMMIVADRIRPFDDHAVRAPLSKSEHK
ncbi:MAG: serine hydrolase [Halieaceae bacterium]|jgi:CubicO group peptidase (beta-lactamase class C family)|nr:serine hydrolase [Halieaceae bacterium]